MNKIQKIISAISGYEPYESFSSAQCDYYYDECDTDEKKLAQIKEYAEVSLDISLSDEECLSAWRFLDANEEEFRSEAERFHAFEALGDKE